MARLSRLRKAKAGKRQQRLTSVLSAPAPAVRRIRTTKKAGLTGLGETGVQRGVREQQSASALARFRALSPTAQAKRGFSGLAGRGKRKIGGVTQSALFGGGGDVLRISTAAKTPTSALPEPIQRKINLQRGGQETIQSFRAQQAGGVVGRGTMSATEGLSKRISDINKKIASGELRGNQLALAKRDLDAFERTLRDAKIQEQAQKKVAAEAKLARTQADIERQQASRQFKEELAGRAAPTVPTTERPVISFGAGGVELQDRDTILGQLSDKARLIVRERELATGKPLDESQLERIRIQEQLRAPQVAPVTAAPGVTGFEERIGTLEERRAAEQARLEDIMTGKTPEQRLEMAERKERTQERLELARDELSRAQDRLFEQLSNRGFQNSTFAIEKAQDLSRDVERRLERSRRSDELQAQKLQLALAGASVDQLSQIDNRLAELKDEESIAVQESLQQAQRFNLENQLVGQDAIANIAASVAANSPGVEREIDEKASELLGVVVDKYGKPILGPGGEPMEIPKPEGQTKFEKFTDSNGNVFFYNPTDPTQVVPAPGSVAPVYKKPNGQISSSPTSNTRGTVTVATKEEEPNADNCVKFARQIVPNLPTGLFNKDDKKRAVERAGSKDMDKVKVGDAIVTNEGDWGHVAVVASTEPEPEITLVEANYKPGQVTEGRTISKDDPEIIGFIPNNETEEPQQISNLEEVEGTQNAVVVDTAVAADESALFDEANVPLFRRYQGGGTLPTGVKIGTDKADKFLQEYTAWRSSGGDVPEADDLKQDTKKAATFAAQMDSANKILENLDQKLGEVGAGTFYIQRQLGKSDFGRLLQNQDFRAREQAERDFVNGVLRQESGAAISDEEFERAALKYFPGPNDGPEIIEQKRQARVRDLNSMKATAGAALKLTQPTQEPAQQEDQLQSFLEDGLTTFKTGAEVGNEDFFAQFGITSEPVQEPQSQQPQMSMSSEPTPEELSAGMSLVNRGI